MNTHILIPIKEWEAQRELYINKLKETDKAQIAPSHDYYRLQGICANMDSILVHEKQISLDETKIDLSYIEYCKKNPTLHIIYKDFTEVYKQALLDLL